MDKKLLKNQLGEDFITRPNVVIDEQDYFAKPVFHSIYPQLLTLENGKLKTMEKFEGISVLYQ